MENNKLLNLMVTGGCIAIIYTTGKLAGVIDCMNATDKVLKEHDLSVKEVTIPYKKLLFRKSVNVSVKKITKES